MLYSGYKCEWGSVHHEAYGQAVCHSYGSSVAAGNREIASGQV